MKPDKLLWIRLILLSLVIINLPFPMSRAFGDVADSPSEVSDRSELDSTKSDLSEEEDVPAESEHAPDVPFIESMEGHDPILLFSGNSQREGGVGTQVNFGERVKTPKSTSVSILYPDGSKIIMAGGSEFKIEAQTNQIQWNRLREGSIRGIIKKAIISASNKPRFIIRSKPAVLGVKGTDFIMSVKAGEDIAEVHTLEGSVDVAKDEFSILHQRGIPVNEGKFLKVSKASLNPPQSFNQEDFLRSVDSSLAPKRFETIPKDSLNGMSNQPPEPTTRRIPTYKGVPPSITASPQVSTPLHDPPHDTEGAKPKSLQQIGTKTETEKNGARVFGFEAALLYSKLPDTSILRAAGVAWTPTLPFPQIPFLSIRGHFGGIFARDGSLNNNTLIIDLQVYIVFTLIPVLFVEGGIGEQIWKNPTLFDATLGTVQAGFRLHLGPVDRIFVGYQALNTRPYLNEYKAGVGITF